MKKTRYLRVKKRGLTYPIKSLMQLEFLTIASKRLLRMAKKKNKLLDHLLCHIDKMTRTTHWVPFLKMTTRLSRKTQRIPLKLWNLQRKMMEALTKSHSHRETHSIMELFI